MALSPEQKAQLEELTRLANEPDEDDFDIEIWDETGAGAKVPYHKGKTWLQRFGIDLPLPDASGSDPKSKSTKSDNSGSTDNAANGDTAARYFGSSRAKRAS
jgi:hypothetical protein